MDIDWIQTFVVAAEEGNFHRAAVRLHLAQPTVTVHIQKLEALCGVVLFERIGRGVQLSQGGRRFLVHAKKLIEDYITSVEDMARWQQGYDTTLKICASPVVATTWLPRWIQGFGKVHRSVEFSIHVVDSDHILPTLLQTAHLGFSRLHLSDASVTCDTLYEDPVVFIAPRDEFDFEGPVRSPSDLLQQYPLFTNHHPDYWDELLVRLRTTIPNFRTIQVNQGSVALEWVTERLGVSFFSLSTVQKALLRGSIEQIPFAHFPLPTTYTYLVQPIRSTDLAREFAAYVRNFVAERL